VRHDSTREIAAAVREATAPLLAEIDASKDVRIFLADQVKARNTLIAEHQAENARLKAEIETMDREAAVLRCSRFTLPEVEALLGARDATIMELRDHLSQAAEANKSEVRHLEKVRETLEMALVKLGDERDALKAGQDEIDAAREGYCLMCGADREWTEAPVTAADVQHARERQQGTTYPWHQRGLWFSREDLAT
jgi:chromosome segregation ATPase